jgi:hypothetical protein
MADAENPGGPILGPNQSAVEGRSAAAWNRVDNGLPLTTLEYKAVYVAGLIRHLAESAGLCVEDGRYLPAFLLSMGAIETLGAVARGGSRTSHEKAADGLAFLAQVPREDSQVVVSTAHNRYTLRDCLHRRDFTAHGGTALTPGIVLDEMLTIGLLCLLVSSLDRWWTALRAELGVQRLLAISDIVPLATNGKVVFVHDPWSALADGAMPGGQLQHQSWRRYC